MKTDVALDLHNVDPALDLLHHHIQAKIITGTHAGHIVFIPRIALTTTTTAKDCHLLFTLTRRQFPIKPSYVMTINRSQSQTLTKVGIYLPQSIFTHVQLYVAMSRVKSYYGLQFALLPPSENSL